MAPDLACGTIGVATPTERRTLEGATVSTQSILNWIVCLTSNLLPRQSRTLAVLVAAAIRTERPNLAGPRTIAPLTSPSPPGSQAGRVLHEVQAVAPDGAVSPPRGRRRGFTTRPPSG